MERRSPSNLRRERMPAARHLTGSASSHPGSTATARTFTGMTYRIRSRRNDSLTIRYKLRRLREQSEKLAMPLTKVLIFFLALGLACNLAAGGEGNGKPVQAIVVVAPQDIGTRSRNEMPAQFRIAASDLPTNHRLDPASLEVV